VIAIGIKTVYQIRLAGQEPASVGQRYRDALQEACVLLGVGAS
jgi:hypothetical protein